MGSNPVGTGLQKRDLVSAIAEMCRVYVHDLPDSTPANESWRPSVMCPGGAVAYAYLLSVCDEDASSLQLLVLMHDRLVGASKLHFLATTGKQAGERCASEQGMVMAYACEQFLSSRKLRAAANPAQTAILDEFARYRAARHGWDISVEFPIMDFVHKFLDTGNVANDNRSASAPAEKPKDISWGQAVNGVRIGISSDKPTSLYPRKDALILSLENTSSRSVKLITVPPYDARSNPLGWPEVIDESGTHVPVLGKGGGGLERTVAPGNSYHYYEGWTESLGIAFPGPGKYRVRIALQLEPSEGKSFVVTSGWHEFEVQLTPHRPGTPLLAKDELELAQAWDFVLGPQGKVSEEEVVQKYLNITQNYPGSREALAAYFGAAYESKRAWRNKPESSEELYRKAPTKYYQEIVRQWPDVVSPETLFARAQLANWSEKLEEQISFYRWLMGQDQKVPAVKGYEATAAAIMTEPQRTVAELEQVTRELPGTPAAELAAKEITKRRTPNLPPAPAEKPAEHQTPAASGHFPSQVR